MLYTRSEIVDICYQLSPELAPLLVSLIWHLSRGDPNCQDNLDRFGLIQIPMTLAKTFGVKNEMELLEPRRNITTAIQILERDGLLALLGREFAPMLHSILGLERLLRSQPRPPASERERAL